MMRSQRPVCVCVPVLREKGAVSVEHRENVTADMPFRATAGALLYIAGKSIMAHRTKRFADRLAFLAGD